LTTRNNSLPIEENLSADNNWQVIRNANKMHSIDPEGGHGNYPGGMIVIKEEKDAYSHTNEGRN